MKLHTTSEQFVQLRATQLAYRDSLNYVSQYAFENGKMSNQVKLQDETYEEIRARFHLPSQMACSVPRQVGATYKALWTRVKKNAQARLAGLTKKRYKGLDQAPKYGSPTLTYQYKKDYSFKAEQQVSVLTLGGRLIVGYTAYSKHVALIQKGAEKGTRSATRRLVSISQRERRLKQDANHVVSKRIVEQHPQSLIGLENLTDIRERTKRKHGKRASKKQRKANARQSRWSYAELHSYIAYKALLHESMAIKVDAHYTSQACPRCGHTCKGNRPNKGLLFVCQTCHYRLHADLVGKEVRGTSIQEHYDAHASYPARLERNGALVSCP